MNRYQRKKQIIAGIIAAVLVVSMVLPLLLSAIVR